MFAVEAVLVRLVTAIAEFEVINEFFRDPRTTARILGVLIAVAGGTLGTFLLLRGMALTSDAISHTVLLGIVVSFMVMSRLSDSAPDLSSPWLILGAVFAGVVTVVLTELIHASGLMKQDAALGLAFPFLFALAVVFVSRYVDDVHMDEDAVMVGEIGVAWANTNSHPIGDWEPILITDEDPRAEFSRRCINCSPNGIGPRDEEAEFEQLCDNCGEYSPTQAFAAGLITSPPSVVFWPKAVTVTLIAALAAVLFTLVFYKELKLSTFDSALARSLGKNPRLLNYGLMIVVSLACVAAFDAVGSILVIAFFIIPPATAYLLTNHLAVMIGTSIAFGAAGSYWGYDLARGRLFGVSLSDNWDTSISASMVLMMLVLFIGAFLVSPRYGLVAAMFRRHRQRRVFSEMVLLGHLSHHHGRRITRGDLAGDIGWTMDTIDRHLRRLRRTGHLFFSGDRIEVSERGVAALTRFRRRAFDTATGANVSRKTVPPQTRQDR